MNGDWIQAIQGMILDMDGVLWKESQALADLPAVFGHIRDQGWQVMCMTNNSTRTPDHYLERLDSLGVELEPWQVINSSETTASYLKQEYPQGGSIYAVGEEGLYSALQDYGFETLHDQEGETLPLAVVAGMDRSLTYLKIEQAARLIRAGVPFIGTNPDKTYPTPEGLSPGAGVVLAAIEAASGTSPTIMGKPHQRMYLTALERLGCSAEEVLVVGDRLETDIQGAQGVGCRSALVFSGVTSPQELDHWSPAPDVTAQDIHQLIVSITNYA